MSPWSQRTKPRHKVAFTNFGNAALSRAFALATLLTFPTACLNSEPIERETVELRLDTPSAGWTATPLEAWESETAIYCVFQLTRPEGMSAQVISTITSAMHLPATEKPKQLVALGKTWKWASEGGVAFPESLQSFRSHLPKGAKRIELLPPDA